MEVLLFKFYFFRFLSLKHILLWIFSQNVFSIFTLVGRRISEGIFKRNSSAGGKKAKRQDTIV